MKRLSVWFWIAIAYLLATVSFNVITKLSSFPFYSEIDKISVGANLTFKILAILLLILRRKLGVYLLAVAFMIGLSGTIWDFCKIGTWQALSALVKIGRVNGFVISAAIVVYMYSLMRRGVLNGRPTSNSDPSVANTFS